MIWEKQSQGVGDNSNAVQVSGNLIVNNSGCDPKEILGLIREEIQGQMKLLREITRERLEDFEERIFKKISETDKVNTQAFSDPDFVQTVEGAFRAHARNGDESVADTLIDLIARRSQCNKRDRLALSINQAVQIAADLTIEEFSALAFIMVVRHASLPALDKNGLSDQVRKHIIPLIKNLPSSRSSFLYMQSMRCGIYNDSFTTWQVNAWSEEYKSIFNDGFDIAGFDRLSDATKYIAGSGNIVKRSWVDNSKLVFNFKNDAMAIEFFKAAQIKEDDRRTIIELQNSGSWKGDLKQRSKILMPEIFSVLEAWEQSNVGAFQISTLGMAIGHAYLRHATGFDADLKIWIK